MAEKSSVFVAQTAMRVEKRPLHMFPQAIKNIQIGRLLVGSSVADGFAIAIAIYRSRLTQIVLRRADSIVAAVNGRAARLCCHSIVRTGERSGKLWILAKVVLPGNREVLSDAARYVFDVEGNVVIGVELEAGAVLLIKEEGNVG